MSYDLYFWKQRNGLFVSPADTLTLIEAGSPPDYVEQIASATFVEGVRAAFPVTSEDESKNPNSSEQLICDPSDGGCFIVTWSDYLLTVQAHGVGEHHFNTLIDIAFNLGAALYDPQTETRYDG